MGPFAQPVISAQRAPMWSPFFFSLLPSSLEPGQPSGGISNFYLFIYLLGAERSTSVDRRHPSRRSGVPDAQRGHGRSPGSSIQTPERDLCDPQSDFYPPGIRVKTPARSHAGRDKHRPEMFYRISICTLGPEVPGATEKPYLRERERVPRRIALKI